MQLALAGGGPDVVAHFIVKDDEPGRIALVVNSEIEKRGSGKARVVHLAWPRGAGGVIHGIAGGEQYGELAVGIAAIALQVAALGAGKEVPIHMAQIVPGRIGAVLGELLTETKIG